MRYIKKKLEKFENILDKWTKKVGERMEKRIDVILIFFKKLINFLKQFFLKVNKFLEEKCDLILRLFSKFKNSIKYFFLKVNSFCKRIWKKISEILAPFIKILEPIIIFCEPFFRFLRKWFLRPILILLRPIVYFIGSRFYDFKQLLFTVTRMYLTFLVTKKPKYIEPVPIREPDYIFQEWMIWEGLDLRTPAEKHHDYFEFFNFVYEVWVSFFTPIKNFWKRRSKFTRWFVYIFFVILICSCMVIYTLIMFLKIDEAILLILLENYNPDDSNLKIYWQTFSDRFHEGWFESIRIFVETIISRILPQELERAVTIRGFFLNYNEFTKEDYSIYVTHLLAEKANALALFEKTKEIPTELDNIKTGINFFCRVFECKEFDFDTAQRRNIRAKLKILDQYYQFSIGELNAQSFDIASLNCLEKREKFELMFKEKTGYELPRFLKITPDMRLYFDKENLVDYDKNLAKFDKYGRIHFPRESYNYWKIKYDPTIV